jgi:hypothetical protein
VTVVRVDQDMAAAAAAILPPKVTKELRTRYRQLRVMLHHAGPAATYAFVAARSNTDDALAAAYRQVADGIKTRLGRLGLLDGDPAEASHRQVLDSLGKANPADYARASAEITQLAGWLSRLADAMYQPEPVAGGSATGTSAEHDQ